MTYQLDRAKWLENLGFLQRKLVFLDLNFWINLAEPPNSQYENLARLMADVVQAGKILCPVSPSLLMEFSKRPQDARQDARSQMMDRLSCGLSLRRLEQNFRHELEAVIQGLRMERGWAYSHYVDAFVGGLSLPVPELAQRGEFERAISRNIAFTMFRLLTSSSITWFMNTWMANPSQLGLAEMRQGLAERTVPEYQWRQQNPAIRGAIEVGECESTFQALEATIRKVISNIFPDGSQKWTKAEFDRILDSCPSFWCSTKMMSAIRLNRGRVRENDVWDFLNVAFATPYVDCLACDNPTRHICSNVLQMDTKYGVKIVADCQGLIEWLEGLS